MAPCSSPDLVKRHGLRVHEFGLHKASGIVNDLNDWADEVGNPRYIVDLIGKVTRVAVETVRIVNSIDSRKQEAGLTSHLPGPGAPSKVQSPTQSSSRRRRDFGPSALPLWFVLRLVLVFLGERMWSKSHIKKGLDQGCCGKLLVDSIFCFPSSGESTGSSCCGFESWT